MTIQQKSFKGAISVVSCFVLLGIASTRSNSQEPPEQFRVFYGDRLQVMRERINNQKFADSSFQKRIVDRSKGFNVMLFKATIKDASVEVIEVWGVPPSQIQPTHIKTLRPADEDFARIKKILEIAQ